MRENETLKQNTLSRDKLHRTYAGEIYFCDFYRNMSLANAAERIKAAERFNSYLKDIHDKKLRSLKKNEVDKK